ncbi:GntR family transcriptional regulator [Lewinella sp. IMCC34191]|uniref:GntR family transcriptional regulator n=1 Tax=Lewinella sp. IMCC34191 TaxID=2259172 RepID=UPI000E26C011|nr:GntR family transcriptional regulator [Lewinella sp. IMCC34191]
MQQALQLRILEHSPQPKYIQLAEYFKKQITNHQLTGHAHLPSINRLSARYDLSRDTVRKAYLELKRNNLVHGVRGKGYFVSPLSKAETRTGTLALLQRPGRESLTWQEAIISVHSATSAMDYRYHQGCCDSLQRLVERHARYYERVIICGSFTGNPEQALSICQVGRTFVFLDGHPKVVLQQRGCNLVWEGMLYNALMECMPALRDYSHLELCFSKSDELPKWLLPGFQRFCIENGKRGKIIPPAGQLAPEKGRAYILTGAWQLAQLLDGLGRNGLVCGQDVAVLYIGDDPALETVGGGISSLTIDRAAVIARYLKGDDVSTSRSVVSSGNLYRRKSL